MRRGLDIELIFPIKDEASARLMSLKAELLCESGVIDPDDKRAVLVRAAAVLDQTEHSSLSRRWQAHTALRISPVVSW